MLTYFPSFLPTHLPTYSATYSLACLTNQAGGGQRNDARHPAGESGRVSESLRGSRRGLGRGHAASSKELPS